VAWPRTSPGRQGCGPQRPDPLQTPHRRALARTGARLSFDLAAVALIGFVFGTCTPEGQELLLSGGCVDGLLTPTRTVHMTRTQLVRFVQRRPATALLAMTLAVMAAGNRVRERTALRLEPLAAVYWPRLVAIPPGYGALHTLVKRTCQHRSRWQ
jgi:hypothetical protein